MILSFNKRISAVREKIPIRQKIAARLQDLPAEQVKQVMLQWLDEEDGNLEDLEQNLNLARQVAYGTIDEKDRFVPLTSRLRYAGFK